MASEEIVIFHRTWRWPICSCNAFVLENLGADLGLSSKRVGIPYIPPRHGHLAQTGQQHPAKLPAIMDEGSSPCTWTP
ncbi:hypothetical protein SLA2020_090110 [Shorea laevis]